MPSHKRCTHTAKSENFLTRELELKKKESKASLPHTSLYYIYISIQLHQLDKKKAQGEAFSVQFWTREISKPYKGTCLTLKKKRRRRRRRKERNSNPVLDACRKIMLSTHLSIYPTEELKNDRTLKRVHIFYL